MGDGKGQRGSGPFIRAVMERRESGIVDGGGSWLWWRCSDVCSGGDDGDGSGSGGELGLIWGR